MTAPPFLYLYKGKCIFWMGNKSRVLFISILQEIFPGYKQAPNYFLLKIIWGLLNLVICHDLNDLHNAVCDTCRDYRASGNALQEHDAHDCSKN